MANTNPYRERKWYSIGRGALMLFILAFAIQIPFVISMLKMKVYVSLGVYAATWIFLTAIVIFFFRRSRLNAYHVVDPTIVEQTLKDLESDRIARRNTFISTETTELRKGKKLPVLDVWKTDLQLKFRHGYFSRIEHIVIDPQKREMELLIQLSAMNVPAAGELKVFQTQFYHRIGEFLNIAAGNPQLSPFKEFIDTLIVECDSLREDEKGHDVPFAMFSMELPAEQLWKLSSLPLYQETAFKRIADVRFDDGAEVEPHRMMRR